MNQFTKNRCYPIVVAAFFLIGLCFSASAQEVIRSFESHVLVAHDNATGTVTAEVYAAKVTPDTKVATIVHTSPVTGMGVDVAAVAAAIRAVAPECYIIVDGIQHAAHGRIDLTAYGFESFESNKSLSQVKGQTALVGCILNNRMNQLEYQHLMVPCNLISFLRHLQIHEFVWRNRDS